MTERRPVLSEWKPFADLLLATLRGQWETWSGQHHKDTARMLQAGELGRYDRNDFLEYPSEAWWLYLIQWLRVIGAPPGFRYREAIRPILQGRHPCPESLLEVILGHLPTLKAAARSKLRRSWREADARLAADGFAYRPSRARRTRAADLVTERDTKSSAVERAPPEGGGDRTLTLTQLLGDVRRATTLPLVVRPVAADASAIFQQRMLRVGPRVQRITPAPGAERGGTHVVEASDVLGPDDPGSRWRHVVVTGPAGSGKTWLLRSSARTAIEGYGAATDDSFRVVAYIRAPALFRRLASEPNRDRWIKHVAALAFPTAWVTAAAKADVESLLREGFLLVDAIDEVRSTPTAFVDEVIRWFGRLYRVALGVRPDGLPVSCGEPPWVIAEAMPFDATRLTAFVRAWFGSDRDKARVVLRRLRKPGEHEDSLDVVRSPLLASCVCHLADTGAELNTSQARLLESVLLTLLTGSWHSNDRLEPPEQRMAVAAGDRLELLATAVGTMVSEADEAELTSSFAVDRLSVQLKSASDYTRHARRAIRRWRAWASVESEGGDEHDPPVDPVLWEYLFDGVLVPEGDSPAGALHVGFAHQSVLSYCVGRHVSNSRGARGLVELASAKRFSSSWRDAVVNGAGLITKPEEVVQGLLQNPDPWGDQLLLASTCVVDVRSASSLREEVIERAESVVNSKLSLLRDHAQAALQRLLPLADLAELDEIAIRAQQKGNRRLARSATWELCRRGKGDARRTCEAHVADPDSPIGIRLGSLRALAEHDIRRALNLVRGTLIAGGSDAGWLRRSLSLLASEDSTDTAIALAPSVFDTELELRTRMEVAELLPPLGKRGRELLVELLSASFPGWNVRARLCIALLNAHERSLSGTIQSAATDPNVSGDTRAAVLTAALGAGVTVRASLVSSAMDDGSTSVLSRADLAEAWMANVELPPIELPTDDTQARALPWLVALIRREVPTGVADAQSRLDAENLSLPVALLLATELLRVGHLSEERLLVVLDQLPAEPFSDQAVKLLVSASAGFPSSVVKFLEPVETAALYGPPGLRLLTALAQTDVNTTLAVITSREPTGEQLSRAALAIAHVAPAAAHEIAAIALELADLPSHLRGRILSVLIRFGDSRALDVALDEANAMTVRRLLWEYLTAHQVPRQKQDRLIRKAQRATISDKEDNPKKDGLVLNVDQLHAAGAAVRSPAHGEHLLRLLYQRIEFRVGQALAELMTMAELDEFERFIDEDDERGALDWLLFAFPEYEAVVRAAHQAELEALAAESTQEEDSTDPAASSDELADWTSSLSKIGGEVGLIKEWVSLLRTVGPVASLDFLLQHWQRLVQRRCVDLLRIAEQSTAEWPPYEAHRFILTRALTHGRDQVQRLYADPGRLHLELVQALENADERHSLDCASWYCELSAGSPVPWFYASLAGGTVFGRRFALQMMARCRDASPSNEQRAAGLHTLHEYAALHSVDADLVAELARVLT